MKALVDKGLIAVVYIKQLKLSLKPRSLKSQTPKPKTQILYTRLALFVTKNLFNPIRGNIELQDSK